MAVGNWHTGKVVLLWIGVIIFYWCARETHNVLWGVAFLGSFLLALIVTWKWISARERRPPG